eukprot:scaffold7222_cov535-Prasinococcus_capsulatus_cf.AAC.3
MARKPCQQHPAQARMPGTQDAVDGPTRSSRPRVPGRPWQLPPLRHTSLPNCSSPGYPRA